ncbi:MAG: OmpA family protein [bacterium]|nr:OmpA family protein [bacterium]
MKKWRVVFCMALCACLVSLSAPAQAIDKGTAELGLFGRVSFFDPALNIADWGGFGARAGYFVANNLALEADMSFTSTDGIITEGLRQDVQVMPFHARLNWHRPYGERTHLMVGAGYVHTEYGDDANASGDGAGLLLGFRYQTLEKLSFRFEATADWYSDTDFTAKEDHVDYGVQFGFSGLFGGGPGDGDKDGVTDDLDRCPETPRGEAVDANGCPLPKDSDGDGVMDDADKCPDTPQGEKVDANGCPLPKDSDGDGVLDNADKCPNTPRGEKVDRNGCPLPKDSDGDGVIDDNDKCPGTPAGTKVDKNGCPQLFEESKATLVLEGVNFETAKAELTPGAREVLDRVAVSLAAYPEIRVEVAGHTDNKGSRGYNVRLSQKRAESVRDYLVSKGIAADRMVAKGYGPDKPLATNDTEEGRAQNRRTELSKL